LPVVIALTLTTTVVVDHVVVSTVGAHVRVGKASCTGFRARFAQAVGSETKATLACGARVSVIARGTVIHAAWQ
jgi:hypothetical protein